MRNKCPGSGVQVERLDGALYAICPTCNVGYATSTHGRLRAHSLLSKAQEAFERRKYRINPRTGEREPLEAKP